MSGKNVTLEMTGLRKEVIAPSTYSKNLGIEERETYKHAHTGKQEGSHWPNT